MSDSKTTTNEALRTRDEVVEAARRYVSHFRFESNDPKFWEFYRIVEDQQDAERRAMREATG